MISNEERYASYHNKAKLKTYRKSWQNNHMKQGLCLDCNEQAIQGKRRCQKHLDYQADLKRGIRKWKD